MILSPGFVRGLVVAIAAAMIAPVVIRSTRRDTLWIISVPAAAVYYGTAFPGFVVVSILGFLTARALGAVRAGSTRWRWTAFALVVLAVLFTAGRLGRWDRPVVVVSETAPLLLCTLDMWLALRLVTLFWEVGSGAVAAPATAAYVGWVALPMTLGGPLLRYSELPMATASRPGILRSPAWWGQLTVAAGKIGAGALLGTLPGLIGERWPEARLLRGLVLVFISGPPGFYLMFAGYYQAMQLLARLAGVDVPDSFNWPFGRENISAFWASWNMTATRVFRDYLFYNRWGTAPPQRVRQHPDPLRARRTLARRQSRTGYSSGCCTV